MVLSYILFNLWACVSGFKEGALFSQMGAKSFKWDIHRLFVVERGLILLLLLSGMLIEAKQIPVLIPAIIFSFSFWHDGMYYCSREIIDTPEYDFTSESHTSTAKIELSFEARLTLKILSVLIMVIYYLVHL